MIPITDQLVEHIQAERRLAADAARKRHLASAVAPVSSSGRHCSSAPSTVQQRVAVRLGFVPAHC